jgi:N-acetylmuramoyl-L-alanine amidase
MIQPRVVGSVATLGILLTLSAAPASAAILPAAALYADAQAKERAVRRALSEPRPNPAVLKAVRTVVAEYESVVRHYPATAYCDDALWNAAQLSIEAYRKFGEAQDSAASGRLFKRLSTEYPTSQWARQAQHPPAPTSAPHLSGQRPATTARSVVVAEAAPRVASTPSAAPSPASSIVTAAAPATITGIERTPLHDVVRLTIAVSAEVTYREQHLSAPPRLFFDFPSTRPSSALMDRTLSFQSDGDVLREVRVGRHPNQLTRVVLDTAGASTCNAYPLYAPYRLVIDCLRADDVARARSTPAPRPVATTGLTKPSVEEAARKLPPSPPAPLVARHSAPVMAALAGLPLLRSRSATPLSREDLPVGRPPIERAALRAIEPDTTPARVPTAPSPPVPSAPVGNLSGGYSMARQLGLGVSRIVIDPGHGGHDPGAKNSGITEATLVLDIALRLEQLLQQVPGTEVILTRRADLFVPLEERTAMANREGADLFLSIHANASATARAGGVETYFLNFATTRQAAAVAARENAASGQSMNALPDFVKAIALNNKAAESRDFATEVQRALVQRLRSSNQAVRDLGVKQAPFVVLIGATMPSVLAEVAFVTNDQEARLLRGAPYRQQIAEALSTAVQKYQVSLTGGSRVAQP